MNYKQILTEEIYGNQAVVFFNASQEKLNRIISGTFQYMDGRNESYEISDNIMDNQKRANGNNTYLFTVTDPNDKAVCQERHYGDCLIKAAVKGLQNFYFTTFNEYKKLFPNANQKTWRQEQIKRFGLDAYIACPKATQIKAPVFGLLVTADSSKTFQSKGFDKGFTTRRGDKFTPQELKEIAEECLTDIFYKNSIKESLNYKYLLS